ncbi:MAG TPA: alpha-ketoacid dehydrogenase subunit beta, partial [Lentisphaerae bacterium]|nr:alpha-ketoacid dehydrogenase subunit beta [Lentisphaerota bacterium]
YGAEILAFISEEVFHLLDAPPVRVTAPDVPIPFAPSLEAAYRPSASKIKRELLNLIEY